VKVLSACKEGISKTLVKAVAAVGKPAPDGGIVPSTTPNRTGHLNGLNRSRLSITTGNNRINEQDHEHFTDWLLEQAKKEAMRGEDEENKGRI
jgi:hypothetical protein